LDNVEEPSERGWHPQLRLHITIMQRNLSDESSAATVEYHAAFWDDDWDHNGKPTEVIKELNLFFGHFVSLPILLDSVET
jgi:hypothetical protein